MIRRILILLSLLVTFETFAQDASTASFGLGGSADTLALKAINRRMAEIRKTRPTVALVLSGGGAKGAAHIGVLSYMKDSGIDIPIDMVLGTSMGGLVGALYSIGYTPEELDSLMRNTDWWTQVSDYVPRENRPLSLVKYDDRYALSFPFYNMSPADKPNHGTGEHPVDIAAMTRRNLLGSLPSGFYHGHNVYNLISSLTVGYQDSLDFFSLPTPFVCVATDLVSARAKVWHDDKLPIAMRTTMSAPGFFTPVRYKGMFLVDGGMRNNFPTDIAKAMGADIVIGIDLSQAKHTYDDAHNLGDVLSMSIDLMDSDSHARTMAIPDLLIKPELEDFNATNFGHDDIVTMLQRGYDAGKANDAALREIEQRVGHRLSSHPESRKIDIGQRSVIISGISIKGVDDEEIEYVKKRVKLGAGDSVDKKIIENAVADLYGTGFYRSVTYELLGKGEPFELVISCTKAPVHRFGAGIRVDTEEVVSLLVNVGLFTNKVGGRSLNLTGKIGINPAFSIRYAYEFVKAPTLNVRFNSRFVDRNRLSFNGDLMDLSYNSFTTDFYLSNPRLIRSGYTFGLRNNIVDIRDIMSSQARGDYDYSTAVTGFLSLFGTYEFNTLDSSYFPSSGVSVGLGGEVVEKMFAGGFAPFGVLDFGWKQPFRMWDKMYVIPSVRGRFLIGDDIPISYANVVGGSMDGRYLDQQMAFSGITGAAFRRNYIALGRVDLRYSPARNHYFTASFNYVRDFYNFNSFKYGTDAFGASLEYAYDTIVGPFRADIHWSNLTRKLGIYLSFGYNF